MYRVSLRQSQASQCERLNLWHLYSCISHRASLMHIDSGVAISLHPILVGSWNTPVLMNFFVKKHHFVLNFNQLNRRIWLQFKRRQYRWSIWVWFSLAWVVWWSGPLCPSCWFPCGSNGGHGPNDHSDRTTASTVWAPRSQSYKTCAVTMRLGTKHGNWAMLPVKLQVSAQSWVKPCCRHYPRLNCIKTQMDTLGVFAQRSWLKSPAVTQGWERSASTMISNLILVSPSMLVVNYRPFWINAICSSSFIHCIRIAIPQYIHTQTD